MIYYGSVVWVWLWQELGLYRDVVAGGRVACWSRNMDGWMQLTTSAWYHYVYIEYAGAVTY